MGIKGISLSLFYSFMSHIEESFSTMLIVLLRSSSHYPNMIFYILPIKALVNPAIPNPFLLISYPFLVYAYLSPRKSEVKFSRNYPPHSFCVVPLKRLI